VKLTVTGATGTIGSALVRELSARGDQVTVLSRDANRARSALGVEAMAWAEPKQTPPPAESLRGRDGVVHLLGENIAQRWSDEAKREIRDSRVLSTRNLVAALRDLPDEERPAVLVSQSACGWYGPRGAERLDESQPAGSDFQASVIKAWEAEAREAEALGLRVVTTRTGVLLAKSGGALEKMLPFFKLGVGGPVAGGRQYLAWVHLDDVVGAIIFALDSDSLSGPVNVTAPEPPTNKEFSTVLGRVLNRPAFLPVPGLAVKTLYGQMSEVVTRGQRAVPARLTEAGYRFRQPQLEPALRDATGR
jgi:uncharacterized protein (TIGR01777 family)